MAMDFNERVLMVVRSFIEYGRYGRDEKKAVKIIRQHHPEMSLSACQDAFNRYMKVYSDTISFVNDNKDHCWELKKNPPAGQWPISGKEAAFIRKHGDIPEDIVRSMIWFIFDWHHVR